MHFFEIDPSASTPYELYAYEIVDGNIEKIIEKAKIALIIFFSSLS